MPFNYVNEVEIEERGMCNKNRVKRSVTHGLMIWGENVSWMM